jgi:hypothetical protein
MVVVERILQQKSISLGYACPAVAALHRLWYRSPLNFSSRNTDSGRPLYLHRTADSIIKASFEQIKYSYISENLQMEHECTQYSIIPLIHHSNRTNL